MRSQAGFLLSWMLIVALAVPAGATVHVALVPSAGQVAPGENFQITLRVTQEGSPFNGYEAVIGFEPSLVTFLQEEEGPYMSEACGTFHTFEAGTSELSIDHAILCAETSLRGPGDLFFLEFQAGSTPGSADFLFVTIRFFDAGQEVPVSSTAGTVQIGDPSGVSPDAIQASTPGFQFAPNPFSTTTPLRIRWHSPGIQMVRVLDPRGRLVRVLDSGHASQSARTVSWDGRDERGRRLPAGVYWIQWAGRSRSHSRPIVLIP